MPKLSVLAAAVLSAFASVHAAVAQTPEGGAKAKSPSAPMLSAQQVPLRPVSPAALHGERWQGRAPGTFMAGHGDRWPGPAPSASAVFGPNSGRAKGMAALGPDSGRAKGMAALGPDSGRAKGMAALGPDSGRAKPERAFAARVASAHVAAPRQASAASAQRVARLTMPNRPRTEPGVGGLAANAAAATVRGTNLPVRPDTRRAMAPAFAALPTHGSALLGAHKRNNLRNMPRSARLPHHGRSRRHGG